MRRIHSIWSTCKSWIYNHVYRYRDKCGRLVPNPSAMINSVHFLLEAMLPCFTPFSTSGAKWKTISEQYQGAERYIFYWQI